MARRKDRSERRLLPESRLLLGALVVLAGLGTAGLGAAASRAGADPTTTYYLAIGASESVGVQPNAADPRGQPTHEGYADDLAVALQSRWPGLQLIKLGCPGETAASAVSGTGPCRYPAGSQLATAVAFLNAHGSSTVFATVDLGFNDLRPCLVDQTVDQACVTTAVGEIGRSVAEVVSQLRSAGGPGLHIVGLEHNDPYLGDYTDGTAGQAFAQATLAVFSQFNAALANVYTDAGVPVADVPHAFDTGDQQPTALAGYGKVPADVTRLCTLTWTCAHSPFPHNVHPNTQGYQVIADAVASALGTD